MKQPFNGLAFALWVILTIVVSFAVPDDPLVPGGTGSAVWLASFPLWVIVSALSNRMGRAMSRATVPH